MLTDGVRALREVPSEKIDAVLAADQELSKELQEELAEQAKIGSRG